MIDVLLTFIEMPSSALGVTEIARAVGASKATVYRDLQTLLSRGMLDYDERTRRYRLGVAAVAVGARASQESLLRTATRGTLEALSARTGEAVLLSARVGSGRATIDSIQGKHEAGFNLQLGRLYSLHAGASGKAILAFLSKPERDDFLARPLPRLTDRTITDPSVLRDELEVVRSEGYAVSRGERLPGSISVACPVFGRLSLPIGSISVAAPRERVEAAAISEWAMCLTSASNEVTSRLDGLRSS